VVLEKGSGINEQDSQKNNNRNYCNDGSCGLDFGGIFSYVQKNCYKRRNGGIVA
jgi:hypothetical protein